ncbi:hypothetical protein BD769DRAFT_597782 [Suillus cothurnatus]|nr:hypothetical protein BD769DRAFT_597782 [Suillus cothurnatus]
MTLLSLVVLLLLHISLVHSSLAGLNGTGVTTFDVSVSSSINNTRTLRDIIWSCAATLFACAWSTNHLNIPGMDKGKFTVFSRRLGIIVIALITPDRLLQSGRTIVRCHL